MRSSSPSPQDVFVRRYERGFFNNLPTEIIISILSYLPWKDLLSIRRASRYLKEASKTKSLWENILVQEFRVKSNAPSFFRPELPMNMYCSRELEHSVLRWKSACSAWRRGEVQRHKITHQPIGHTMVHLIKGGRWLLRLLSDGALVCYDLDHAPSEAINIAAPAFSSLGLGDGRVSMSVQELDDSPVLSVRVALLYAVSKKFISAWSQELHRVDMWSLTVALDDSTKSQANLVAKQITSFPLPSEFDGIRWVVLLGNEIAFKFTFAFEPRCTFLTVIDWTKPNGKSTSYPRRYVAGPKHDDAGTQSFLVGNDFIFMTNDSGTMSLVSYANSQQTTALPNRDSADGKQVWRRCGELLPGRISGPFLCATSTRFVIEGGKKIVGVIINHNKPEATEIVQLATLPSRNLLKTYPGYHHTIFYPYSEDASTLAISFCWPDEEGNAVSVPFTSSHDIFPPAAYHSTTAQGNHYFRVLFDEGSGRIITLFSMKRLLMRWETSPLA